MSIPEVVYTPFSSPFGKHLIIWREVPEKACILRIILPQEKAGVEKLLRREFPEVVRKSRPDIEAVCAQIQSFLQGASVVFSLDLLDFRGCSDFQRKVLLAEARVPRGRVTTYGRLAQKIGAPRAARAVGGALSRNPFPLIISCHRAIRTDGHLGGFRGGLPMKRALLKMEGIVFDERGRVPDRFIW